MVLHSSSEIPCSRGRSLRAAFTLVELLVAVSIVGMMSATSFVGLAQLNYYAVTTRLYTTAQAVAQNAIDEILTKGPFDPSAGRVPAELALGTHAPEIAFIYKDPDTGAAVVTGTLTCTISDSPATIEDSNDRIVSLNIRRAVVNVSYRFRNRNYSVVMNTLRASDQ